MFSAHRFRLAAPCAVLALGLLPRLVAAQSADTPFFAEDLTRARLGEIANVDEQATPLAHMAPDGHMVITGDGADIWVRPGKFIEMLPDLKHLGYNAVTIAIFEDNIRTLACGLEQTKMEMLRIEPPTRGVNRKRVRVDVFDAQGKGHTIMQCVVRSQITNATLAALTPRRRGEQCSLEIEDRQRLSSACLYLGDIYMGRVAVNAGEIKLDERKLPPGKYTCQMVAQNEDGILLPGISSEYIVPDRYIIACADMSPIINVPEHNDDAKIMVTISRLPGVNIAKTRVYMAGKFVAEKTEDSFTIGLPMKDVPTGINTIEVIGVGPDNVTTYPVESKAVNIKNTLWEQNIYHTAAWERITENKKKIKALEQKIGYWLELADNEPENRLASRTHSNYWTYTEVTERFAPGKRGTYLANAKSVFIEMTQLQLEAGKLYGKLEMRNSARNMLYRVIEEAGSRTANGIEASAELAALKKERATTL